MNIEKNTTRQNNYEMYNFLKTFGDEPVWQIVIQSVMTGRVVFYLLCVKFLM